MNLLNPDVRDLVFTAFCFGIAAGLSISYLMTAIVWRMTMTIRIADAADRVAEKLRQEAQIELNERLIEQGHARLVSFTRAGKTKPASAVRP